MDLLGICLGVCTGLGLGSAQAAAFHLIQDLLHILVSLTAVHFRAALYDHAQWMAGVSFFGREAAGQEYVPEDADGIDVCPLVGL